MKTKYMTIYVKNKKQKNIGCIRESFYDIATGPSNHDMKITWLKVGFLFCSYILTLNKLFLYMSISL